MDIEISFKRFFGKLPSTIAKAPGRVNLLGEHIDYNDGIVLPTAIDRAIRFAAAPSTDEIIHLYAVDFNQHVKIGINTLSAKTDVDGNALPGWALYPAGVASALHEASLEISGLEVAYTSDIPIGSGLSSSAAVEVGFAVLWQEFNPWKIDPIKLAQICQRAENNYVGVSCGLMDQFACACGVEGHALYLDTRSLEWGTAPLPKGSAIVIADTGIRRNLTQSAYNERRASCELAVELLREHLPGIKALRDVSTTEFAAYKDQLPSDVRPRAEHVVKEIARVESALSALQRNDHQAIGALMYAGHRSLRDLYEVSIPELDLLVEISRGIPGCIGARLTGAGFGGCTVNLVHEEYASSFIHTLTNKYQEKTGALPLVYLCKASQGAHVIKS